MVVNKNMLMLINTTKRTRMAAIAFVSICYSTFLWWQQDDFYIHLQYAKNFSRTFIWAFNAGIPSYGTTSPLWVLLLSCFGLCRIDLIFAAKSLSFVLGIAAFYLLFERARGFANKNLFYLCVLSMGLNHWYRLAVGAGMEATLASVCITFLFVRTYYHNKSAGYYFINGAIMGLCALVRPELIYVALVFVFADLFDIVGRKKTICRLFLLITGAVVVVTPWIVFAELNLHQIIPTTVLVKTGHHFGYKNTIAACTRVIAFYLPNGCIEIISGLLFLVWIVQKKVKMTHDMLLRIGLVAGIPVLYLVNQAIGGASISYRYAAPTIPIIIFSAFKFLDFLIEKKEWRSTSHYRLLMAMLVLFIVLPNIWLSVKHTPFLVKSNNYLAVLEKYGKYLKGHASPKDTVACYDVGAIGYYSDRFVLDLVGLVSPETIKYQQGDMYNLAAITVFKPKYLVVPWFADMSNQLNLFPKGTTIFRDSVYNYRFHIARDDQEHPYSTELRELSW
jgi:arabinofuranosyltransferase